MPKSLLIAAIISTLITMGLSYFMIKKKSDALANAKPPKEEASNPDDKFDTLNPITFESIQTSDFNKFIAEVQNKEKLLKDKETQLKLQEERIKAEKQSLDVLKKNIIRLQKEFDQKAKKFETTRIAIDGEQSKNIKELATTYATLSPQAAVSIMDELAEEFAVQILSRMKPEEIGPIFEEMTVGGENMTKKASRLSNMLRLLSPN